ncbi:MAG: hypothetical protein HOW71_24485 [Nonomuraea sp.]|nr:hypothetical protein [Nonomuraea sp.]
MTVLCLGLAADPTFMHGVQALRSAGVPCRPVDLPSMALRGDDLRVPPDDPREATFLTDGGVFRLGDHRAVWSRLLDVSSAAPDDLIRRTAARQFSSVARLLEAVDLPVLNPPLREASGFTKVLHSLALGGVGGWPVPRTCLTNDPAEALDFVRGCPGGAIFKGASAYKTWATRFTPEHEPLLPRITALPVLFQELIAGPDVRVHMVGDQGFAELIRSPALDYRTLRGVNTYSPLQLPADILANCAKLTAFCEIPLLGIDFKLEESTGTWFFLEANSLPCFEGYDRRADGAISRAIVNWLTTPAH